MNYVIPELGFMMNSNLHAHFSDLMDISRQNSKNESCLSMSLEHVYTKLSSFGVVFYDL